MDDEGTIDMTSYVALAAGVVALGTSPLLVRSVAATSLAIAAYRTVFTVPIGLAAMRAAGGSLPRSLLGRSVPGGIFLGLATIIGYWSLRETSVLNFMVITALQPLIVGVLAARVLGERPTRRELSLSAIALAAVVVLVLAGGRTTSHPFGDLLALVSVLMISSYMIAMKRARNAGAHA
ncbi:MAG TPA: EamA family transporter, partial [Acidimicrobiales bacterium]|nr:EamA family transporter [Acidimicrobiales bacterium]